MIEVSVLIATAIVAVCASRTLRTRIRKTFGIDALAFLPLLLGLLAVAGLTAYYESEVRSGITPNAALRPATLLLAAACWVYMTCIAFIGGRRRKHDRAAEFPESDGSPDGLGGLFGPVGGDDEESLPAAVDGGERDQ
jgi:hypothetical protein